MPWNREKPLIMIADDDNLTRTLVANLLRKEKYSVIEAKNGNEVLSLFKRVLPDILLLNIIMPEKDGLITCHELRKESYGEHVPILMITVLDSDEAIEEAFAAGADDYIKKPINGLVLKHRVRRLLETEGYRKKLETNAARDFLTGCLNRRAFTERLVSELHKATAKKYAIGLILCDLDNFKGINDTFGHTVGDMVLKMFVEVLHYRFGKYGFVGRHGGDEFIICLPKTTLVVLEILVQMTRMMIQEKSIMINENKVVFSSSFGIALMSHEKIDSYLTEEDVIADLITLADNNLYLAKEDK